MCRRHEIPAAEADLHLHVARTDVHLLPLEKLAVFDPQNNSPESQECHLKYSNNSCT